MMNRRGVFSIEQADDAAIDAAATGLRPPVPDQLPKRFRFAPSSPTYKIQRSGAGTYIYLYGTGELGHSVCVRVEGFSPYLFVSLASIDAATPDANVRETLIAQLIEELQARLLAVAAADSSGWAPERHAFRESFAGRVKSSGHSVWLEQARNHCAPIVGWEIVSGMPVRGSGPGCGYRGMDQTRFLKLYFYAPTLVPKCRAILQGEHARLGASAQARELAAPRFPPAAAAPPVSSAPSPALYQPERQEEEEGGESDEDEEVTEADEEDELVALVDGLEIGWNSAAVDYEGNEDQYRALQEAHEDATEDSEDFGRSAESGKKYAVSDATSTRLEQRIEARFQRRVKRRLEATLGERCILAEHTFDVYEADVDFVLRFALDCGFSYEHWLELDLSATGDKAVQWLPESSPVYEQRRETRAQIELRCNYSALAYKADDPIQNTLPKHLLMSLDCEMETGEKGAFPAPATERMLMCVFLVRDDRRIEGRPPRPTERLDSFWYRSISFVLGSVACETEPRVGCWERFVLCFEEEAVLYAAMARFVQLVGASIVTGYNTDGFDLPYMRDRSREVGAGTEFMKAWGRSAYSSQLRIVKRQFESTAVGAIEYQDVRAEGVVFMDLFLKLKKDPMVKLRSLALNSVSAHYLDEQKEDVAYSLINGLSQTASGREKLRLYCEKDTLLPLMIIARQQMIGSMIEMSRINGCTMEQLLKRGQQIRSMFGLYREAAVFEPRHFPYTRTEAERALQKNETFEGANVVDPQVGLYGEPVSTLDFASLYPSIMCSFNFCFSTYVAPDYDVHADRHIMQCEGNPLTELTLEERQRRAAAAIYTVEELITADPFVEGPRPGAHRFLRHHIKVGLAVHTEMKLLAWRKRVKKEMAAAKAAGDKELAALLNERQTQIKLLCNSLYGAFGATSSRFYCQPVSASVTARGRAMLWCTAAIVKRDFAEHRPAVIYGDTDSVFVHMPLCKTVEEAAAIGVRMAAHITAHMKSAYKTEPAHYCILQLEFEKVFRVLLLIAKKRYAGLKYVYEGADADLRADPGDCLPSISGLDSNRRDVTLLIKNEVTNVISLMVDYHHSTAANLARAREYIWREMVRPIRENRINLQMLAITKQLRMLPADYAKSKEPGAALPIHVQMAQRMIVRAGGEDKPNAPRAGDRLAYVVAKGEPDQKVSERAEDPVYMLEHALPIDYEYYLEKHIRSVFVRLFAPAFRRRLGQSRLNDLSFSGETRAPIEANEKEREELATEYLFGHAKEYRDPGQREFAGVPIVPATVLHKAKETEKRIKEGRIGIVPVRNSHTGAKIEQVRYAAARLRADEAAGESSTTTAQKKTQSRLGDFGVVGARCRMCRAFQAGASIGVVCAACMHKAPVAVADEVFGYLRDIEDLRCERAEIAHTCHTCMGCATSPTYITCANSDCPVYWQRQNNQRSERTVATKLKAAAEIARKSGLIERF